VIRPRVIQVVEDTTDLRHQWRTALSLEGFDVAESADGIEALQYLEQHRPDLVVLDLGLPRLDGVSVRQEIAAQSTTRNIPVVIVTGSVMPLDHLRVSCVLRKPFSPEHLVDVVRCCLTGSVVPES